MRLFLLGVVASLGVLYSVAAYRSYREEHDARADGRGLTVQTPRHPETNLRVLREAFETSNYSDELQPFIDRSLREAPAYYQVPFLMATFLANRLDDPARIRGGFEAAVRRFPSNGRLHLTFAEWLLTPRSPAPYRLYREASDTESLDRALHHLEEATRLEPDLTRRALELMLRFRVPPAEWVTRLPRNDTTKLLILGAVEGSPRNRNLRGELLREFLTDAQDLELLRGITTYAGRWGFAELGIVGASKWRELALARGDGRQVVRAATVLAALHLDEAESDRAFRLVRETLNALEQRAVPTDVTVDLLVNVGNHYLNRGQRAMAQALLAEAITLSPYHVPAHFGLARIYQADGDIESARRELEQVLRLEPAHSQATTMLGELLAAPRSDPGR